jgi:hypothetical protein
MIRGYQKTEVSTFIPRLGSGDQTESEFDLLKSKTIDGFTGGMLQRYWQDNNSAFAIEGLVNKYDDGTLYPVNGLEQETDKFTSGSYDNKTTVVAFCRSKDYMFVAVNDTDTMTYNSSKIYRVSKGGSVTTITTSVIPSTSGNGYIKDMVIWNDQLWVTSTRSTAIYYMSVSSTTLIEITAGDLHYGRMVVYNGSLYGTNIGNNAIWRYNGTTSSRSSVKVGDIGKTESDDTARLLLYNNRIILTRSDGLYAYDGVRMVTIEDMSQAESTSNYRYATVMRGYLYYFMPDGLYRFNGSLIEKLYDISEIGFPSGMEYGDNKLWMTFNNTDTLGSSRYDKSMGYDYTSSTNMSGSVMYFDGKGLYTYGRVPVRTYSGAKGGTSQGIIQFPMYFDGVLYVSTYLSYDRITYRSKPTVPTTSAWLIATSIFDADFPMIDKSIENVELVLDGVIGSDETITIEYRTSGFAGASGWASLGTITTQTNLKNYVWNTIPAGLSFKNIQLRLTGTTSPTYGIKKLILRYILQPEFKTQWTLTALCYGDNAVSPLQLADDTEGTQLVSTLRGNLYESRSAHTPIKFIDVDQFDLNGAINNSTSTLTLNFTSMLKDSGFVQVDDEIIYYAAKTSTTLTGCLRGKLGTTAASHSDNAKVFPVYRTIIRQLKNENIELMNPSDDTGENKSRNSEITLVIQEV